MFKKRQNADADDKLNMETDYTKHSNVKNKQKTDKKSVRILCTGIGILLLICVFSYLYRQSRVFVYDEHLDDVVLTVDDREVTLREFGYYIYSLEAHVNKQAIIYDHKNPLDYWNKHFRAGLDSQFISLMARDKAYDVCICDMIYEQMALEAGYSLTEDEKEKALQKADELYQKMTELQIEQLGINKEMVEEIQMKKVLIGKFAKDYVKNINFDGYAGYREELISANGDYYEEHILPEHEVVVNGYIKNALKFGRITVNTK